MTLKKDELLLEELASAPTTPATGKWIAYFKSDGLYVVDDAGAETGPFGTGGGASGHGQCYLSKSGANLLLSPYNGNQLIIDSVACSIPDAGVTLAPPAVASTTYYIYAYMNSGTMTLEQSATAPSVQAGTGVQIKTGDATRTLVGMARTTSGNAWADTVTQRFVISYFNRASKNLYIRLGSNMDTTSTSFTEVNTNLRVEFLNWGDEVADFTIGGFITNTNAGSVAYAVACIDGAFTGGAQTNVGVPSGAATALTFSTRVVAQPSAGYHYATVLLRASANTARIGGSGSDDGNGSYTVGYIRG